jgi:hypothetical protein
MIVRGYMTHAGFLDAGVEWEAWLTMPGLPAAAHRDNKISMLFFFESTCYPEIQTPPKTALWREKQESLLMRNAACGAPREKASTGLS